MYLCMYVCVDVFMYVCIYLFMYLIMYFLITLKDCINLSQSILYSFILFLNVCFRLL